MCVVRFLSIQSIFFLLLILEIYLTRKVILNGVIKFAWNVLETADDNTAASSNTNVNVNGIEIGNTWINVEFNWILISMPQIFRLFLGCCFRFVSLLIESECASVSVWNIIHINVNNIRELWISLSLGCQLALTVLFDQIVSNVNEQKYLFSLLFMSKQDNKTQNIMKIAICYSWYLIRSSVEIRVSFICFFLFFHPFCSMLNGMSSPWHLSGYFSVGTVSKKDARNVGCIVVSNWVNHKLKPQSS